MRSIVAAGLILLGMVATPLAGHAADACDGGKWSAASWAAGSRLLANVRERKFDVVDSELNEKLRLYRKGEYSDIRLISELQEISERGGSELEPFLLEWTKGRPGSFFAFLIKGINHLDAGYRKRGTARGSETSPEQFDAMTTELAKAVRSFESAIAIDPNVGMVYAQIITAAKNSQGAEVVAGIWLESMRRDPGSMAMAYSVSSALSGKWVGSDEHLDRIQGLYENAHTPPAKMNQIRHWFAMDKGRSWLMQTGHDREVLINWQKALAFCENSAAALVGATEASMRLKDWQGALAWASKTMDAYPNESPATARRASIYEQLNEFPKALADYQTALDLGSTAAKTWLENLRFRGPSAPENMRSAIAQLRSAAEQGDALSQQVLGTLNFRGQGMPANLPEALQWYLLAAKQGNAEAQYKLGFMYATGWGVDVNVAEGLRYLRLAAGQGKAAAQMRLAKTYEDGLGVPVNYSEARDWYRFAAQQGNVNALEALARYYECGCGVEADPVKALSLFIRSAYSGSRTALGKIGPIRAKLTAAEILRSEDKVAYCYQNKFKECF